MKFAFATLVAGLGLTLASSARAQFGNVRMAPPAAAYSEDTYYVTFFAYQRGLNVFNKDNSHTMALFSHVPASPSPTVTDTVTISWMPLSGVVSPLGPMETGQLTNLDFELRRGGQFRDSRGFAWGPYRIPASLYNRAAWQAYLLQTGRIWYKAAGRDPVSASIDYLSNPNGQLPQFLNCLAAVGDILPGGVVVGAASGQNGTRTIVQRFAPWFLSEPNGTRLIDRHRWVSLQMNVARFNGYFPQPMELEEVGR
jgi:hypothetical protein